MGSICFILCLLCTLLLLFVLLDFAAIKPNWTLKSEQHENFVCDYHTLTKDPLHQLYIYIYF